MLWAIDVGNTHTVVGLHDADWRAIWRLETSVTRTEDQLAATLSDLCGLAGVPFQAEGVMVASVVPAANEALERFAGKWLRAPCRFLTSGEDVGLEVTYDPPHAVGADRIANALAALERYRPPLIVVDFGTATTFDTVDAEGRYIGGAILPGAMVALDALAGRTAKLPRIALRVPAEAIGRNTVQSLESGVMFGYAGAIDALVRRIKAELGGVARVVSTGGLGTAFQDICVEIEAHEPNLTLEGLRSAWSRSPSP